MRITVRNQIIDVLEDMERLLEATESQGEILRCIKQRKQLFEQIREEFVVGFMPETGEKFLAVIDMIAEIPMAEESGLIERLLEGLYTLKKMLKEEQEVKLELVFLPYKASMWDSMESVYLAAAKHPRCNAYAIPIPYFSKNEDGSLGEKHYEGYQFPEELEMSDYESYDLAGHCPDVIFVHNPYDNMNRVTSIEPEYYSENLRKYTEHLVYIPYYVDRDFGIGDNFKFMLPVIRNAWKIVTQNEVISNEYRECGMGGKVLMAGSPKVDKLFQRVSHKDWAFSDEAAQKMQGRKSVLLNTHLSPLLANPVAAVEDINSILELFCDNKDMVLWWRPHPLSLETINTCSSEIKDLYNACVQKAKEMENCFYDDTPELERALVCTDAYLGHESSLVPLYAATGKMVYVLPQEGCFNNAESVQKNSGVFLSVEAFCKVEDEIWFVSRNFNALYRMSYRNRELKFVLGFKEEVRSSQNLCKKMVFYQNEIWFIPSGADRVYILNLRNMQMESLELPIEYHGEKYKTGTCCVDGNNIWIMPFGGTGGYRIDMDEKRIICLEHMVPRRSVYDFAAKMNHMIVATDFISNQILCYNVASQTAEFIRVKKGISRDRMIMAYGQGFYLFSDGEVYKYNQQMELLEKKLLVSDTREIAAMDYLIDGTDIWLAYYPDFILCWDTKSDQIDMYQLEHRLPICGAAVLGECGCGQLFQDTEKVYCLPSDYGYFIEIDKHTGQKQEYPLTVDLDWVQEYLTGDNRQKELRDYFYNPGVYSINSFLQILRDKDSDYRNENQVREAEKLLGRADGKVGETIIDYIVKELCEGRNVV